MSWLPIKTDYMKQQMEHTDTKIYADEIHLAVTKFFPEYKNALEIGAAWGVSAAAILLAGNGHLTSVDSNLNIKAPAEIKALGLTDRWVFTCQRSEDFWNENKTMYDVICVDGSHLYKDVKNDLFEAWERLNPSGLLIIDDYLHPKNQNVKDNEVEYGVSLACWELMRDKVPKDMFQGDKILGLIKQ